MLKQRGPRRAGGVSLSLCVCVVLLAFAGCSSKHKPAPPADAGPVNTGADAAGTDPDPPDTGLGDANVPDMPAMPDARVEEEAGRPLPDCVPAQDAEYVETRCDGLDNDCNGEVDALLPVEENACTPTGNTCAKGFAACVAGKRVCMGPGPAPEVADHLDNDCNGSVDDIDLSYEVHARALVLIPSYLLIDGLGAVDNVTSFLEQRGVPYDLAAPIENFDTQLTLLPGHSLAIVPGYLVDEMLTPSRVAALQAFAQAGGIVVIFKPVLEQASPLLGLKNTVRRVDLDSIDFITNEGAARAFDTPEERSVPLTALGGETVEAFVLKTDASSPRVVARGTLGGKSAGALIAYRPIGKGGIYSVGHDLYSFLHYRCYINCFEPSGDLAGLFLREAFRDSARGHIGLLHTVPGSEDSLATVTHDVDAPDAQNAGPIWGAPGALQVSQLEAEYGARGSHMVTTDYVVGYYNPQLMQDLCDLDMCPVGSHSVTHSRMTDAVQGSCEVTAEEYDAKPVTVCGEVRASLELLERDVGKRPIAWRAPYLGVPPFLYDVLASEGVLYDSSYAIGDLKFNLPLSMARTAIYEWMFHRQPMYTMPISIEDGIGDVIEGVETRTEMSEANAARFVHHWVNVMLRNADNHAHTMALLHPSYGRNVPQDNLRHKLGVLEAFLQASVARGVKLDLTVDQVGEFWRARERSKLDVQYDGGVYTGTLRTGANSVRNLTLEFGDPLNSFTCATCGKTRVVGRRVVLEARLQSNTTYTFTADAVPDEVSPIPGSGDGGTPDGGMGGDGGADSGTGDCVAEAQREEVETRCDGLDNDCNGVVDALLPITENACTPEGSGSCGGGYAACIGGARVCLGSGPAPEVEDDIDNDCNGTVDDYDISYETRARALLLIPSYLLIDGLGAVDNVTSFLEQWGIPYDVASPIEDFDAQLEQLDGHTLAVVPGYLMDEMLTPSVVTALEAFAQTGGVVVVFKPVLANAAPLLGLEGTARRVDLDSIDFVTNEGAARAFDTAEERSIPLTVVGPDEMEAFVLTPNDPSVQVLAQGTLAGASVGPLVTFRPVGTGGIYAVGHDLYTFLHYRCYVNCFEPSSDLAGLFLREAYRDSARGHIALLHTVPGPEDSLVTITHDVDAPDAQNEGPIWGAPGALQVAQLEAEYGARGSYMVTTDYVANYYNPQLMQDLCDLDMCPVGTHSITHSNLTEAPKGECEVTQDMYDGSSIAVCPEIRISMDLLERDVGKRPLAWRAPYLGVPPFLFDVLKDEGILFDSSFAVGELKFNLPLSAARTAIYEWMLHRHPLYTMPISIEDGIGEIINGEDVRSEMGEENGPKFVHHWVNVMLRNADNHAHTMALLHPSYGLHVPQDNLRNKLAVLEAFMQASVARGVKLDATVDQVALFWRAREHSKLDVAYAGGVYSGTLQVGDYGVKNLTLEFGDPITAFECESCGATRVVGRRVVLEAELSPNTSYSFTADALPN